MNIFPEVVRYDGRNVILLDQTALPVTETYITVTSTAQMCDCIKRLVVRGAPAIGCAGAFGTVLAAREALQAAGETGPWLSDFEARCAVLSAARPTAVNLRWAVNRCLRAAKSATQKPQAVISALEREAQDILDEDKRMCSAIGHNGAELLKQISGGKRELTLHTHCNAGALATGGTGTALAVVYAAAHAGIAVRVIADETRPLLQGARLTAWELHRAGVPVTVICDGMAAAAMRKFKPDAIIVGADRIAANGDTANKIGTYGLAVLAKHAGVPFLVAAPGSTLDLSLPDGSGIEIEERAASEIGRANGIQTVPDGAGVWNPAFDVTPADLITAIITEKGVYRAPFNFA